MEFNKDKYQEEKKENMLIEPGKYKVAITDVEEKPSQSSGAMMIVLEVSIISDLEGDIKYQNRKLWDYLIEGSAFVNKKIGQILESIRIPAPNEITPDTFMGYKGVVAIKNVLDNRPDHKGEMQSKISYWVAQEGTPEQATNEFEVEPDGTQADIPF